MIEAVLKKYSAEGAGKDGDEVKTKPSGGETQNGQSEGLLHLTFVISTPVHASVNISSLKLQLSWIC